jgi:hypothetical protein
MGLRSKVILFLLMFLMSCSQDPDAYLVSESPILYQRCDMICKKKFGEKAEVFSVRQKMGSIEDFVCFCR